MRLGDVGNGSGRWTPTLGPDFKVVPPDRSTDGILVSLLNNDERRELAQIASVIYAKPGSPLYKEGEPMDAIYNLISGVVKTAQRFTPGKRIVTSFLFPTDLFGNGSEGRHVDSAFAVTSVTTYRLDRELLVSLILRKPRLQYHFIRYASYMLRESERHAIMLSRTKTAASKLAAFLDMLQRRQSICGESDEVHLVMRRSDIASYLALSLEAISRAFRALESKEIIKVREKKYVRINDRKLFNRMLPMQRAGQHHDDARNRPTG